MSEFFNDLTSTIKKVVFIPVHPAGWPIIAAFAVVFAIFWALSDILGFLGFVLLCWCVYFFRDPIRVSPTRPGLVLSPADGVVSHIEENVSLPSELDEAREDDGYTKISVFLNVFNVHVNRSPVAGKIEQVVYKPGKFVNAALDKASEENERSAVLIETNDGKQLAFVQIAGLVARRIICDLKEDQVVAAGEKYGLIRFGSRADIYLPKGVHPLVCKGQLMIGGETVLADLHSDEGRRYGEERA